MEQLRLQFSDLGYLAPELTLVVAAVVLSILDLVLPKRTNRNLLGWLALVSVILSAVWIIRQLNPASTVELLEQSYRIDDFANLLKLILLTGAGLVVLMSLGSVKENEIPHKGEYYYLLLPATVGGMMMASSGDLITLYVGLELLSITSYILAGFRKTSLNSNEGSFKYLVLGGVSSATILYGMSFLYGMTGSTNIAVINEMLGQNLDTFRVMAYMTFFLLLAGFGFKVAAFPFHTWAPDVYQGAPTPVTAFLAVVSKAAAFAILFRVMYGVFGIGDILSSSLHHDGFLAILFVAAAAMIAGNFAALKQQNMKRMLAFSGIANSGYLLVPIGTQLSVVHFSNFTEFAFYLIAYLFMNIGAFAVFQAVEKVSGREDIGVFAGLYYRAPYTAVAMVILLLSLAGLPLTGGFIGKLYIILATLGAKYYAVAAIMILTSVVSFYYYFGIIRQMFMRAGDTAVKIGVPLGVTIWLSAIVTVLLGLFPHLVMNGIENIFSLNQDLFIQP
jgi:NADH-quinone oxidoreductase subunit N